MRRTPLLASVSLAIVIFACGSDHDDGPGDADGGDAGAGDAAGNDARPPYTSVGVRCARDGDSGVPRVFDAGPRGDGDAGSGDAGSDAGDAGSDGGSSDAGAGHPPLPQIATLGGSGLASPTVIPITFANDDDADRIEDFVASFGCTSWWRAVTRDYGVGDAVSGPPMRRSESFPETVDDSVLQKWLRQNIESGSLPPPNPGTVYALFIGAGTTVQLQGLSGCTDFGGYHDSVGLAGGQRAAYAVIPRCDRFGPLGGFDVVTGAASHEFAEAATDPYPRTTPAFAQPDDDHIVWAAITGGEVADMCAIAATAFFQPGDYPFVVQRSWSNSAAFLGKDPCVPAAPGPYFNAAPVLRDEIPLTGPDDVPTLTRGVKIAVGGKATIDVALFSDDVPPPWTVTPQDLSNALGSTGRLTFALDRSTGSAGDVLHLTIFREARNKETGVEPFVLVSSFGPTRNFFFGLVGDP